MRDLILILSLLGCIGLTLRYPFAGVLTWAWLTCMNPHQEVYGLSKVIPLNLIVAVITIVSWMLSKERKHPQFDATTWAILGLLAWMTFNTFYAANPTYSWPYWDRTWRIMALGVFVGIMATNQVRIHALVWVVCTSLLYYGVKGGLLTFLTGGTKYISGPIDTIIGDNNHLAVALLMTLPLVNYLRLHTASRLLRIGLIGAGFLSFVSLLGSYSRGGYLALSALTGIGWLRSRRKVLFLLMLTAALVPMLYFMPQSFYDRVNTLSSPTEDASFQSRLMSWKVSYFYAVDHFPFGAGFYAINLPEVYNTYFPGATTHAAHSIYFQILGEQGFPGLVLYLIILLLAFRNCYLIRKMTKKREELRWLYDLATMIQLSLVAFCVGGAALSIPFYDMFIIWVCLLPVLRNLATKSAVTEPTKLRHSPVGFTPGYRPAQ